MQPADIMQNDLINPIRLELETNELSHSTRIKRTNHIQPHTTAACHDRGGQTHAKRAEPDLLTNQNRGL
jgi:hypothetical protein